MNPQEFGIYCEDLATKWLIGNGYTILDRNFRSRFGEIDIIACKNKCYLWVEVKGRNYDNSSGKYDSESDKPFIYDCEYLPRLAVTKSKLNKILKTSNYYCMVNNVKDWDQRVLVIEVYCYNSGEIEIQAIEVD